jgi:F-type H+-transporting ATPase subunit epsilon
LKEGTVVYKSKEGSTSLQITGGFVEVLKNKVVVLADGLVTAKSQS